MRKYKHHISYIVVIAILFGLTTISNSNIDSNSNNVSALSYSSSVGVGFTFNPTLSVSISPSDLVISNLVPGNTLDSNAINVSVASNASYGYTLSAIVNGNNSNLTHSNGTNIFSSIATDADLADLEDSEDTNIWGYSTSLDSGTTWSNYSGLSSSNSATLLDTNTNNTETGIDSIDFKIAAKASNAQASGTYTGAINFTAVTKHVPITLAEAYASEGKTMINGFYAMQDMTSTICSKVEAIGAQLQVLDKRDNKLYWISKLADNHCWMTQNLDFDIDTNATLNSTTTDLNIKYNSSTGKYSEYNDGYTDNDDIIYWKPTNNATTIDFQNTTVAGWVDNNTVPYSANKTDNTETGHASLGNYYNWTAAIASNNSSSFTQTTIDNITNNPKNSICPKGWRLPTISKQSGTTVNSTNEFARLAHLYNLSNIADVLVPPLYFVKSGYIANGNSIDGQIGIKGLYLSSTSASSESIYDFAFTPNAIITNDETQKRRGFAIRCVAH